MINVVDILGRSLAVGDYVVFPTIHVNKKIITITPLLKVGVVFKIDEHLVEIKPLKGHDLKESLFNTDASSETLIKVDDQYLTLYLLEHLLKT